MAIDHLPYSPNFWLFQKRKGMLKGKHFLGIEGIKSSVERILTDIPVQDFEHCFEQWPKHWGPFKRFEGN
jgi:hypothetical protein